MLSSQPKYLDNHVSKPLCSVLGSHGSMDSKYSLSGLLDVSWLTTAIALNTTSLSGFKSYQSKHQSIKQYTSISSSIRHCALFAMGFGAATPLLSASLGHSYLCGFVSQSRSNSQTPI